MRSSLETVFSHESAAKSLEQTKQYEPLNYYDNALMVYTLYYLVSAA